MNQTPNNPLQIRSNITPEGTEDFVLTDKTIEEAFPTEEEKEVEKKPLTEAEVEEEVGGDQPVEGGVINMNDEDEEADKEADII